MAQANISLPNRASGEQRGISLLSYKGWLIEHIWSTDMNSGNRTGSHSGIENGVEIKYHTEKNLMYVQRILNPGSLFSALQTRFNGEPLFKSGVGFSALKLASDMSLKIVTHDPAVFVELEEEKRYNKDFQNVEISLTKKTPDDAFLRRA